MNSGGQRQADMPQRDGQGIKVSVIIPVLNSRDYIRETLDSVIAQRGFLDGDGTAAGTDMEIILVDDGSTDGTLDVVRSYVNQVNETGRQWAKGAKAVKAANTAPNEDSERRTDTDAIGCYVNQINKTGHKHIAVRLFTNRLRKGAAGARNTGIDEASGRYIAFIDADDKWLPDKLEKQIRLMEKTGAAFSFTGYEFADEHCVGMGRIARVPSGIDYRQALKNTTIFTSTVVLDMDRLAKQDIYFPYIASEDTANWWKILKKTGTASGLDEPLTLYRRSKKTLSSNKLVGIQRIWNLYMHEGLSVPYSLFCFICFAFNAVKRRI